MHLKAILISSVLLFATACSKHAVESKKIEETKTEIKKSEIVPEKSESTPIATPTAPAQPVVIESKTDSKIETKTEIKK